MPSPSRRDIPGATGDARSTVPRLRALAKPCGSGRAAPSRMARGSTQREWRNGNMLSLPRTPTSLGRKRPAHRRAPRAEGFARRRPAVPALNGDWRLQPCDITSARRPRAVINIRPGSRSRTLASGAQAAYRDRFAISDRRCRASFTLSRYVVMPCSPVPASMSAGASVMDPGKRAVYIAWKTCCSRHAPALRVGQRPLAGSSRGNHGRGLDALRERCFTRTRSKTAMYVTLGWFRAQPNKLEYVSDL